MGEIGTARILAHSWNIARSNAGLLLVTTALLTALSVALDESDPNGSRTIIVDFLASFAAQYLVTRRLIDDRWPEGERAGALPVFGVLLVSSLAILLGLVLLIVPGIILAVRWLPVVPILMSRNEGVLDALRESWGKTQGSGIAIFAALAVLYSPMIITVVLILVMGDGAWASQAFIVTSNVLMSLGLIAAWVAAVAFCELAGPRTKTLENVFA